MDTGTVCLGYVRRCCAKLKTGFPLLTNLYKRLSEIYGLVLADGSPYSCDCACTNRLVVPKRHEHKFLSKVYFGKKKKKICCLLQL